MSEYTNEMLRELQSKTLDEKIAISLTRILEFAKYFENKVYVSYSGGKDSTVLLDLVRKVLPNVDVVFSNTGLEYPEIQQIARKNNAKIVYPEMGFHKVITKYGYPIISKEVSKAIYYARKIREREREYSCYRKMLLGKYPEKKQYLNAEKNCLECDKMMMGLDEVGKKTKSAFNKEKWLPIARDMPFLVSHYCCDVMKKRPIHKYEKSTSMYGYIGTLTSESRLRKQAWLKHGCNAFDGSKISSQPLSFWTEQDILEYIQRYNLEICSVYGKVVEKYGELRLTGVQRTGCIYCGFGCHLDKESRYLKLKETHPDKYNYCINGGQWIDNPFYVPGLSLEPDEWGWINWNPKQIWSPSKDGLGLGRVFDMINEVYGENFIVYK